MSSAAIKQNVYYLALNGQQVGPYTSDDLMSLLQSGNIQPATKVWCEGMSDWAAISTRPEFGQIQTSFLNAVTPPPIQIQEPSSQQVATAQPVENNIVWALAFAPLIGAFLEGFFSGAFNVAISKLWWITVALNITLCIMDEQELKKKGHDTEKIGSAWLVPVYLYNRSEYLKHNKSYFITWCVLFGIMLLGNL